MKTTIRLLAVLALALTVFGQNTAVSAGGGGALNFRGPSALANFSSLDPTGCVVTDVFIIGSDSVSKNEPGPSTSYSFASVTVSQYDLCNSVQVLFAYGNASPLAEPAFQASSRLDSAVLTATAYVFDEVSGTNFTMDINMRWTGSGPLTRSHNTSNFHSPGCIINSRMNGTFRDAQAAGSIVAGATNFTPQASTSGNIASIKSGTVAVGCN